MESERPANERREIKEMRTKEQTLQKIEYTSERRITEILTNKWKKNDCMEGLI